MRAAGDGGGVDFLREYRPADFKKVLRIINVAAGAYRGAIPDDCFHEPYMPEGELAMELKAGVKFWVIESNSAVIGVMGIQAVKDVDLIRHAYVLPQRQRGGVGTRLMEHLMRHRTRRMLVGTWADAAWAIRFYERHGFSLVSKEHALELLGTYWRISNRQAETSVVLELSFSTRAEAT